MCFFFILQKEATRGTTLGVLPQDIPVRVSLHGIITCDLLPNTLAVTISHYTPHKSHV